MFQKRKKIISISVLLILVLASSCSLSLKKRTYRKGYYVSGLFQKNKVAEQKYGVASNTTKAQSIPLPSKQVVIAEDEALLASAEIKSGFSKDKEPGSGFNFLQKKNELFSLRPVCNDSLYFKTGEVVAAKIFEINDESIKYKRCDNVEGPSITVSRNKISKIKYANGVEEIIKPSATTESNSTKAPSSASNKKRKTHPQAVTAIIFAALAYLLLFLFAIPGLIFANKAIRAIKAEPDKYDGLELAQIARIASIVMLILGTLAVLLLIVVFAVLI